MYGRLPQVSSDTLKIRYWRTGRHVPANRHQCMELGMPYMNCSILSNRLSELGYQELEETHTTTDGYYLDWLLIQLFKIYDEECRGKVPEYCLQWFQQACRILDEYFGKKKEKTLRFMYFKALGE